LRRTDRFSPEAPAGWPPSTAASWSRRRPARAPARRARADPSAHLLVDERGIIRWIDQTDDYKVRSSAERVLAAVADAFGASLSVPAVPAELPCDSRLEPECGRC
jgi:hypothetical protein